ncbi:MAG: hypothetical protein QM754_07995 [Tepidisphaeraceae bacterium]
MDEKDAVGNWKIPVKLEVLTKLEPWFVLAMATQLSPEQWAAIVTQLALADLRDQVRGQVRKALMPYPPFCMSWLEDITNEVLIKLSEGRFWRRYQPTKAHPMPYVLGCAYQYARTIGRSYWRRFGRDMM